MIINSNTSVHQFVNPQQNDDPNKKIKVASPKQHNLDMEVLQAALKSLQKPEESNEKQLNDMFQMQMILPKPKMQ